MYEFFDKHLGAILATLITGLIGLLVIKYGRHKPAPDLKFMPERISCKHLTGGRYLMRVISDVMNIGDKSAVIEDVKINGISPANDRSPGKVDLALSVRPPIRQERIVNINFFEADVKPGYILPGNNTKEKLIITVDLETRPEKAILEIFTEGRKKPFKKVVPQVEELGSASYW